MIFFSDHKTIFSLFFETATTLTDPSAYSFRRGDVVIRTSEPLISAATTQNPETIIVTSLVSSFPYIYPSIIVITCHSVWPHRYPASARAVDPLSRNSPNDATSDELPDTRATQNPLRLNSNCDRIATFILTPRRPTRPPTHPGTIPPPLPRTLAP